MYNVNTSILEKFIYVYLYMYITILRTYIVMPNRRKMLIWLFTIIRKTIENNLSHNKLSKLHLGGMESKSINRKMSSIWGMKSDLNSSKEIF